MTSIAIILARGGSKRLPGKNKRMFHGRPLVVWTIEAALLSKSFDKVLLSTDSQEIAEIGIEHGAEVPFLRDRAADDHSASSQATLAALDQAEEYWDESFAVVAQLMANCPLRTSQHVCDAMNHFSQKNASSQISCFKFGWMNPWWAAKMDSDGCPEWVFPKAVSSRSQDLPDLYCPSGALWIAKSQSLRAHQGFYSPDHIFNVMDWMSAMDIDDEEDWVMAEACKSIQQMKSKND